jgi:outer membrane protein TolC
MRVLVVIILAGLLGGCSRAFYRLQADKESYHAIRERDCDPRWQVPHIGIDPPPGSRIHDPYNPDHPAMPPDDPAAHRYMRCVYGMHGYRRWHKDGDAPSVEPPDWIASLPLDDKGDLLLTPERAVDLGLLDSREYQTQLENLYLSALALTLDRFEFDLHWFGRNNTTWQHFGSSATEVNTLTTASEFGFTRNFAAGGQLMFDLMNSFVFEFAGRDHTTVTSNLVINFIQPLLRNAGRQVRLEALTQAERNVLYTLRDFAHFRKTFTFNVATQLYLQLLLQEQGIRNQQTTLTSLEQSYRLHQTLFELEIGNISSVKVDQVFQQLQQARLSLIRAEADLQTALDNYKITLGLPPSLPVRLDDSSLTPFQLTDPAVDQLQKDVDAFRLAVYSKIGQVPALAELRQMYDQIQGLNRRTFQALDQIAGELERWKQTPLEGDADAAARERAGQKARTKALEELREDLEKLGKSLIADRAALKESQRQQSWETLQRRIGDQYAYANQLVVLQTQVRVFLIRLRPIEYDTDSATRYALANRLDLMNTEARVVDAWRQIAVTASALKTGLNLAVNANVATTPLHGNPVDFRASVSSYSVGVQLDTPLNREIERNAYRTSLITYQRARRAYMALDDGIQRQVRLDIRQLRTEQLNFEIARDSLVAAARQVESANEELLLANPDPTSTQNILNALNDLLRNKNDLIGSWVRYETGRIQLLLDLDALQLDERGWYANEQPSDNPGQSSPGPCVSPGKDAGKDAGQTGP